jgi:hypothetical protein
VKVLGGVLGKGDTPGGVVELDKKSIDFFENIVYNCKCNQGKTVADYKFNLKRT